MNNLTKWSDERVELLKRTYCKGGTDLDLQLFIATCERLNLSPEAKQIYAVIYNGVMSIMVAIDGYRLVADRTDLYEGQTPVEWCGPDGIWKQVWMSNNWPSAARVGVYKKGFKVPLYAVAHWQEYAKTNFGGEPVQFWKKMPRLMLGKVAEALALRKAFPNELSGTYTPEEMPDQFQTEEPQTPVKVKVLELKPTPEPLIQPVESRIPKMIQAFQEHFSLNETDVAELLGKPTAQIDEGDMKTIEKLFKDLKAGYLDNADIEVIKAAMTEPENAGDLI